MSTVRPGDPGAGSALDCWAEALAMNGVRSPPWQGRCPQVFRGNARRSSRLAGGSITFLDASYKISRARSEPAPEALLELLAVAAAQGETRAGPQDHGVLSVQPGLHLLDPLHVHDARPVDAEELLRIES